MIFIFLGGHPLTGAYETGLGTYLSGTALYCNAFRRFTRRTAELSTAQSSPYKRCPDIIYTTATTTSDFYKPQPDYQQRNIATMTSTDTQPFSEGVNHCPSVRLLFRKAGRQRSREACPCSAQRLCHCRLYQRHHL